MSRRGSRGRLIAALILMILTTISACSPTENGPPEMVDVERHLGLVVPYVPEGCDPVGLGGDGRGRMVDAGFDCPERATFRVERFAAGSTDDEVPGSPSETNPGRVEWRDGPTGDVIRVVSDDVAVEVLLRVAEAIEVQS